MSVTQDGGGKTTRFSTITEVAQMLRVHRMTVRRMVQGGELPAYRFGNLYRIPTAAVWAYIEQSLVDPHDLSRSPALSE